MLRNSIKPKNNACMLYVLISINQATTDRTDIISQPDSNQPIKPIFLQNNRIIIQQNQKLTFCLLSCKIIDRRIIIFLCIA